MEAISVAKRFAQINHYEIDPNQEFIALGISNMIGSFFSSYPVTGSFSRTAVGADAGARTPVAGIISSVIVALALLFLTPLFYFIPGTVLSSVIITALLPLVDAGEVMFLWRAGNTKDMAMLFLAFFGTISLGVEYGMMTAWAISLLVVLTRTSRPHCGVVGRMPGTEVFAYSKENDDVIIGESMVIFRIGAPLLFTNSAYVKDRLLRQLRKKMDPPTQVFIIDASHITDVDSTAVHMLELVVDEARTLGITIAVSEMQKSVRRKLYGTGLIEAVGRRNFFTCVRSAITHFSEKTELEKRFSKAVVSPDSHASTDTAITHTDATH
eukprot:GFYU01015751.1.p1 GENE.GFYU01015751.1~~GFYU01015751.1.p1  ORF type:complete len:325 (-),score=118.56 GFYU01015751.1:132-1106(-)